MSKNTQKFNESIAIMDDQTWIWSLVASRFQKLGFEYLRIPSDAPIRESWRRLEHAERLVIHWESAGRRGGAVVEDILTAAPDLDPTERLIILTTNPTHEDVVYFSELGLRRIIKLRNREKDLNRAGAELEQHLTGAPVGDESEQAWRRIQHQLDTTSAPASDETVRELEEAVRAVRPEEYTARYMDALGSLALLKNDDESAQKYWKAALDKNPNYYRSYHNLIAFYRKRGNPHEAMSLMQKMHELNRDNISRLVGMGEIQMELDDWEKAEFYFKSALEKDRYCGGALNGLAEIRFHQGNLEESRKLLSRSHLAYKAAQNFNRAGVAMVKAQRFEEALEHYTKAQYVLPQQDKGPLLFYNIGLCYSRWGKLEMARQFLKIALIKDPEYEKAQKLLRLVESRQEKEGEIAV